MYPHNFKVQRLDGTIYDLETLGVYVTSLNIKSPAPVHNRESIGGRSGYIDLGTEYDGRTIQAKATMAARDSLDFPLLRDEVFRIFDSREAFYFLPDESPGKQILVKNDSAFSMSRKASIGEFDINLSSDSSYFESIGTTSDPFTFDEEIWQIGEGLTEDDKSYTSTSGMFSIFNAGDVALDPRQMPLSITYTGASTNLQIKNNTTGDLWTYTGTSASGDTIILDGIRSTKNALSIFRNTNHGLITLAPGWNDFQLVGTSGSFNINFDFRFYYI